jgi:xeroderma pigmentosum group C-complementing protein
MFMDVFGYWQTVPYILPKVIDGKIERNDFGNIYMFLPSMLPLNCVHLHLTGVHQVARTLGLEAVPAVVGWDFKKGRYVFKPFKLNKRFQKLSRD